MAKIGNALVYIGFVKQNINQVLLILFTKLVNCTFADTFKCGLALPTYKILTGQVHVSMCASRKLRICMSTLHFTWSLQMC